MKTNRSMLGFLALTVALGLGRTASAQTATWTGSTDGTWGTPANWNPSGVPGGFSVLTFPDVVNQTIDVQANRFIGSLTFNAPDPYVLNNGSLTVNGGPISNNGAGSVTINSEIPINNNFNFTGTGTGTVTMNGAITGVSKAIGLNAPNLTLVLAGNNSYSLSSSLTAGRLLVTGTNSSTAAATLGAGTLALGSSSTMPLGTGLWTMLNGSTVVTADATPRSVANALSFIQTGTSTFGGPGALDLSGPVNFGSGFHTADLNVTNLVTISGNATDGGLGSPGIPRLQGPGTLVLSGSNSFSYVFYLYGGTLRLASPYALPGGLGVTGGTCGLYLYGGVVELAAGDLYRNYGGGSGATGVNVTFLGSSGFAAVGGNRIVNLGGASATDMWGAPYFVPSGSALLLGSATADSQLDFQNPLNLNGAVREVRVDDNPDSATDQAKLSGQLSNGGLLKTGSGKLILSANNTYAGATTVSAGTLVVNGTVGAGGLTINSGAHLGGSGTISSVIGGAGSVDPGNSPGILTVNQVNPTGGLGFNFEFTNAGSLAAPGLPDYTNPLASRNDVLRITNAAPFTAALTGANVVDLYLASSPNPTNGYYGGFYTDAGNFAGQLTNATFLVYLLTPGGPVTYNGNQYNLVTDRLTYFAVHTVNQTGPGGVTGFVTEFDLTLVPEPSVLWLAAAGGWLMFRRRSRARVGCQ